MGKKPSIVDLLQNPQPIDTAASQSIPDLLGNPEKPSIVDLLGNPEEQEITAADQRSAALAGVATGAASGASLTASTIAGMKLGLRSGPWGVLAGGLAGLATGMYGSTFIDDLLKKTVVPPQYYKDPKLAPYFEGAKTFGSIVASAPTVFGIPTLVGGRIVNAISKIGETARKRPALTLLAETATGVGAGIGGGSAVAYNPDSPGLRFAAEIIGSFFTPANLLIKSISSLPTPESISTVQEKNAIKYLKNIFRETNEDPNKIVKRLNEPLPKGVPSPTAGQKTGSLALMTLEQTLSKGNRRYGSQIQKQAQDASRAYEKLIMLYRNIGNPEALKKAAEMEKQFFYSALNISHENAEKNAAEAISKILVDTPATRARVGEIVKNETEEMLRNARDYQTALWRQAEADSVDISPTGEITLREITPDNTIKSFLKAVTSISPEYFINMNGHRTAEAILKRFGINKNNIELYQERFLDTSFLKNQEVPDSLITRTQGRVSTLPRNLWEGGATVKEMIQARGDLLSLARIAAPNDIQAARIYGEMAEGILKDLDTLNLPAYETARNYSAELNNFFTRTYVADINAKSRTGAERFSPEVLVAKVFGANNDITASRMQSVFEATGSLNVRYEKFLKEFGPEDPRVLELEPYAKASREGLVSVGDAQRQWLLLGANRSFVTDVKAPNGLRLDRNKLIDFIDENKAELKDAGLLDDLKNANVAETAFINVKTETNNLKLDDQKAFAKLLGRESPTQVIQDALNSTRPAANMGNLINLAAAAGDGGAAANGLKTSLYDYAYTAAGGLDGNFSPTSYYDALFKEISLKKPSIMSMMRDYQLISAREANDLKRLLMAMRRVEEGVANKLELDQLIGKEPSFFKNLMARIMGSRLGAMAGSSGAGELVLAGAGSRAAQNFFEKAPNLMIQNLLQDASKNPELLATLLSKVDLSNPSNIGFLKQTAIRFAVSGFAPIATAINNFLQSTFAIEENAPASFEDRPQARVQPPTVPTRGAPTGKQTPGKPQINSESRQLLQNLFPLDRFNFGTESTA